MSCRRTKKLVEVIEKTKVEMKRSDRNVSGDVYIGSGKTEVIFFLAQAAELFLRQLKNELAMAPAL